METLFTLNNICKSYFSDNYVTQALHNISLSFENRGFIAITGESGSGKSTLLNILAGTESFDEGDMFYNGENVSEFSEKELEVYRLHKISFCYQNYNLIEAYSVLDNIVSTLLLMGVERNTAINQANIYLSKVGLQGLKNQKAANLSSGQKQRLSIARALAKGTGILLLDEPTGNLDSKTGNEIIKLLSEISKEALVIMVTHNFSQCEEYINRKIYMNSGTIVTDSIINPIEEKTEEKPLTQIYTPSPKSDNCNFLYSIRLSLYYAIKNLKNQFSKSLLYFIFFLILSCISFVFIGELYVQKDDVFTKQYTNKAFMNKADNRIVCKKSDNTAFTKEELSDLSNIKHVISIESHDIVTDINIYTVSPQDYEKKYGAIYRNQGGFTIKFNNDTKFMNSQDMISYGFEETNTSDLTLDNCLASGRLAQSYDEIVIYSENPKENQTVTIYFRAQNLWDDGEYYVQTFKVSGYLKEPTDNIYFSDEFCRMISFTAYAPVTRLCYAYDIKINDYSEKPSMICVINNSLKGNEVMVSSKIKTSVVGEAIFEVDGKPDLTVNVLSKTHDSGMDFLMISPELFHELFDYTEEQISIYIDSYANTDNVLNVLTNKGLVAISTLRASSLNYINTKVNERIITLLVCVAVLFIISILGPIILKALMKNKYRQMTLLTNLGINNISRQLIIYWECIILCLIAGTITLLLSKALSLKYDQIKEMRQYMHINGCIIQLLYSMLLGIVTSILFNKKSRTLKGGNN